MSREGAPTDDEAAKARPRGVWDSAVVAGDGCSGSLADEAWEELDAVDCKDRLGGAAALAGVWPATVTRAAAAPTPFGVGVFTTAGAGVVAVLASE